MKKYLLSLTTALAGLMTLSLAQNANAQSSANLYWVFFSADGVTTNDFGRFSGVFASHRDVIRRCANQNGISDTRNLALVYDRDADALEVVNRTTGDLVCTPISFSSGFALTNSSGTSVERLSFVFVEDNLEASGSLKGSERFRFDNDGNVVRYSLTAKIQFALVSEGTRSKIYSAFLATGPRFVPSGN